MPTKKSSAFKNRPGDAFLHEVSNLATGLSFVTEELLTFSHADVAVQSLVGDLALLSNRLHRAVKEKVTPHFTKF